MKEGFTLIELLVVVSVTILVTGISAFGIQNARVQSRDTKRLADLKSIQSALARFNGDCFGYPDSLPTSGSDFNGNPNLSPSCNSSNVYLEDFPTDPEPSRSYYYGITETVGTKNVSYIICAALTNDDDPDSDVSGCGSCGSMSCNIKFTN